MASQSNPNTVLLSAQTMLHYQGNLMFREVAVEGLKYRTLSSRVAGHVTGAQRVSASEEY